MFPHFAQHQDDRKKLHHNFWTAVLTSSLIVGLVCVLTVACAEPVVRLLLGEEWIGAVPYVWAFAVAMFIQGLGGGVIGAFIYGTGQVSITVWLSLFRIATLPACLFAGTLFGPLGVAWATVVYYAFGRVFSQVIVLWRCELSMLPAPRVMLQAGMPAALGLIPCLVLDALIPNSALGALVVTVPATVFFFSVGCAISLLAFRDPETINVLGALKSILKRRKINR